MSIAEELPRLSDRHEPLAHPVVHITGGNVSGSHANDVYAFRGMPFAAPVGGINRWRAPQSVVPWSGTRDATHFAAACPQPVPGNTLATRAMRWKRTGRVFMDAISKLGTHLGDDCLNLNVWTPSLDPAAKLPVLVFIHGGSFMSGSGAQPLYDGAALAREGIVAVTLNYRLGISGFVGGDGLFKDGVGIANRGYLDQVQAFAWVAENIRNFGGNPDCVTVAGESAGAASALMLAVSPATAGLVHRVISMSGAPLAYPHEETARFAQDCFAALGVKDVDALAAIDDASLFRLPLRRLLRANQDRYGSFGADGFATLVAATGTDLFPLPALEFLAQGRRRDIDLLIGTCRDEARLWTIALPLPDTLAARSMFGLHAGVMNPRHRPRETLAAYRALMPGVPTIRVRERAMTDALFRKPSVEFANALAGVHPGHVWLYRYDWRAQGLNGAFDAIHGVDLPALFETYDQMLEILGPEADARAAGNVLHGALTNFIKTGTPAVPGAAWPPYQAQTKPCMIVDRVPQLRHAIDMAFENIW